MKASCPQVIKSQLVGLPLDGYRKLKGVFESWTKTLSSEVQLRVCPSLSRHTPKITSADLKAIESNVREGYVHIAVFPCRDWEAVKARFVLDCRVAKLQLSGDP